MRESESLIGIRWQHSESGQVFASGSAIDPEAFGWEGQQDGLQVYVPVQYNELESFLLVNKIVGVNGRMLGNAFYLFDAAPFRELVRRGIP